MKTKVIQWIHRYLRKSVTEAKGNLWLRLKMLKPQRQISIEMTWYNNSNSPLKAQTPPLSIMTMMILICQQSLTTQGSCISLMP